MWLTIRRNMKRKRSIPIDQWLKFAVIYIIAIMFKWVTFRKHSQRTGRSLKGSNYFCRPNKLTWTTCQAYSQKSQLKLLMNSNTKIKHPTHHPKTASILISLATWKRKGRKITMYQLKTLCKIITIQIQSRMRLLRNRSKTSPATLSMGCLNTLTVEIQANIIRKKATFKDNRRSTQNPKSINQY